MPFPSRFSRRVREADGFSRVLFFFPPDRRPEGLYVSLEDKGFIKSVLENWPSKERARVAVVTDGSRILGLGGSFFSNQKQSETRPPPFLADLASSSSSSPDLGVGGLGIPIGKLSLYIGGAGIDPQSTVPIV